ncbi:MAG TPA: hypothetical protein VGJ13_14555 [Pseudonocardiaceae bacterium]|jgi:hypothetical protein
MPSTCGLAARHRLAHHDLVELPADGLHFVVGPLLALLLVALLGGMLRWTYGTHTQHVAPPPEHDDGDLGLLREVAVVPNAEAADVLRRRLAADGIRATVRPTTDRIGRSILVFAEDEVDARVVLANSD